MSYKFSNVVVGHTADVRCLAPLSSTAQVACAIKADLDNTEATAFVSGSRDCTAQVWRTEKSSWVQERAFDKHPRYVSALVVGEPNDRFPHGVVYTGSHDGKIRAFSPGNPTPLMEVEAHAGAVSSLFFTENRTLVSGSWDFTAKIWIEPIKCVNTLSGHEAAVWGAVILPTTAYVVTAGADKVIKVWKAGSCLETVREAHTQAIRDLKPLSDKEFLTCSNDQAVKIWSCEEVGPQTVRVQSFKSVTAHDNFIYTLGVIERTPDALTWMAGGEHSGIKIFQGENVSQVLQVPAISVWCLCLLSNGDLAAGCSDGKVWIFSKEPSRIADEERMVLYESECSKFQRPAQTELAGVDVKNLPGPEALLTPGTREGQTKMVKEGANVSVHSWSQAEGKWSKIGDVVGQPGGGGAKGAAPDGGKVTFEGKEYDFVFDIDIEDGVILKLPYNRTQEPYMVAQNFIHKNELPQDYLDTIAQFIIKNSGGGQIVSQGGGGSAEYGGGCDPFTGGGGYKSNGSSAASSSNIQYGQYDPYSSGNSTSSASSSEYFPQKTFLKFGTVPKAEAVSKKLAEFNATVPQSDQLSNENLERIVSVICNSQGNKPTAEDAGQLMRLLVSWPNDKVFPALDLLRLSVLDERLNDCLFEDGQKAETVVSKLYAFLEKSSPDNCKMLSLRTMANMFNSERSLRLMMAQREAVVTRVSNVLPTDNKNIQIAASTVMLNYAVALFKAPEAEAAMQCMTSLCVLFLEAIADNEAKYRILVALGTLFSTPDCDDLSTTAKDMFEAGQRLETWRLLAAEDPNAVKVREAAQFVKQML